MARYTQTRTIHYQVAEPRWAETWIQLSYAVIRRSLILMLWSMVMVGVVSGPAAAVSYYSAGRGMTCEIDHRAMGSTQVDHSPVLAAGFGFQAAGSSSITIRTYDVQTGAILSEDSFDVSVKEEGAAQSDGNRGRIFAGGIGADIQGKSKFMLRVYDAETGRFLWEGELNLLKTGEGGVAQAKATIIPGPFSAVHAAGQASHAFQSLFSVRAVNPITGTLVWQDQFTPGLRKRPGNAGVLCRNCSVTPINEPIEHIFDLVVRTYDRTSGVLLWEDSFEEIDHIENQASPPETNAYPQAIPFWHPRNTNETEIYEAALG